MPTIAEQMGNQPSMSLSLDPFIVEQLVSIFIN